MSLLVFSFLVEEDIQVGYRKYVARELIKHWRRIPNVTPGDNNNNNNVDVEEYQSDGMGVIDEVPKICVDDRKNGMRPAVAMRAEL